MANGTDRRLSVTSTTCAGRRSALRGELAWGRKETQSVSVATAEAGAPRVSVTWSSRLAARAEIIAIRPRNMHDALPCPLFVLSISPHSFFGDRLRVALSRWDP